MRLEHLEYLLCVKKYKSFNTAAKALYMSQPALGAAVTAFEKEVGYPIFERTRKGAIPTVKGEQLLTEAETVLNIINGWKDESVSQDVEGDIQIWATPALSDSILINVVLTLKEQYPKLNILLNNYRTIGAQTFHILNEFPKTKDNFILHAHDSDDLSFLEKHNLQWQIVGHDSYVAFVCADNPLSQKESLTTKDLSEFNLATYNNYSETFHYADFYNCCRPKKIYTFTTREQIMQLVSQNKAIAFFPKISAINDYYVTTGLIKPLQIRDYAMPVTYYMAYPQNHTLTKTEEIVQQTIFSEFETVNHFLAT